MNSWNTVVPPSLQNISMIDFTSLHSVKDSGIYLSTVFMPLPETSPSIISIVDFEYDYLEVYENNQTVYLQIIDAWKHSGPTPNKGEINIIMEGLLELESWLSTIHVSNEEKKETTYSNGLTISNYCDLDCLSFLLTHGGHT